MAVEGSGIAREICAAYASRPDALIEILHDLQHRLGFIPRDALAAVAEELNLSRADVYGVVTFYKDFRQSLPGNHVVKLCCAEACQAMGGDRLAADAEHAFAVKVGETKGDGSISLEAIYCLGLCALAPSAMVDDKLVGRADLAKIKNALADE